MKILVMKVDLRAAYVHSLKEKRMIVKSIIGKLQNKFNVSIREVENQDLHQRISIGIVKLELTFNFVKSKSYLSTIFIPTLAGSVESGSLPPSVMKS